MKTYHRRLVISMVLLISIALAGGVAWYTGVLGKSSVPAPANSLMIIVPYDYNGTWVFDDPRAGLVREPFVAGVPEMIDHLVADIPDAKEGFRMFFSAQPFPGYEKKLTWVRGDRSGNTYRLDDPPMEGWLCPAMFKYFDKAPAELYVKAEPKR